MHIRSRYFTLMEVLIALAVTGIAAMGIFRLQIIGIEAAIHSELTHRAMNIAESQMERAIAEAHAQSAAPESAGGEVRVEDMDTVFRWQLSVEDARHDFEEIAPELPYLWRIYCRVEWGERGRNIELERYVWDYYFVE